MGVSFSYIGIHLSKTLNRNLLVGILSSIMVIVMISGCGVVSTRYVKKGPEYPPYGGEVKVFWKDHGVPADPNTYELIGTVSGRVLECGITQARFSEKLHKYIIDQASQHGGNGVIIYCGEIGTVDACYCYGDIIRFKQLPK